MIIQHNISALNAHRQLSINNAQTSGNLEKLSSGYRINRAADDAAGLAISEKMRGQIRGLAKAEENVDQAVNLIQTAEGGLQETHAILQRMRELAVQSANGTYDNENDRANLQREFVRLTEEIDRISVATHYNGIQLLDGTQGELVEGLVLETATNGSLTAASVTLGTNVNVSTASDFYGGGTNFNAALEFVVDKDGNISVSASSPIAGTNGSGYTVEVDPSDNDTVTITAVGTTETITFSIAAIFSGDTIGYDNGQVGKFTTTLSIDTSGTPAAFTAPVATLWEVGDVDGDGLTFQIGANGTADQRMLLFIEDMGACALGITDAKYIVDPVTGTETRGNMQIGVDFQDRANEAIDILNEAINQVSAQRAELGAAQNRLEHAASSLGVTKENLTNAESTIRDVDMAKEMMEYTKNSILVQASQAMLAQAQSLPQGVLQLLR